MGKAFDGNTISVPTATSRSWNHLHQRERYRERQHAYMIKLTSTENNIVAGTATPFSVPAFTTTGGIQVNGAVVPEPAGGWGCACGALRFDPSCFERVIASET